jgi:hypothetical protein
MAAPLCSKQTTNLPIKKKGKMRVGLKKKQFQRWYTRTVEFRDERKLHISDGSPNETTVRNINYSIDPLAIIFLAI